MLNLLQRLVGGNAGRLVQWQYAIDLTTAESAFHRGQAAGTDAMPESLFEADTPFGFRVRVDRTRWELIVNEKHPAMKGRELDVKSALENPDEVRQSKSDSFVLLFYKTEALKRWVCAVTKRSDEEGFLITAYPTDAIKEGIKIWPK